MINEIPKFVRVREYDKLHLVVIYNLVSRKVYIIENDEYYFWKILTKKRNSNDEIKNFQRLSIEKKEIKQTISNFENYIIDSVFDKESNNPKFDIDPTETMINESRSIEHYIHCIMAKNLVPYTITWEITNRCNLNCEHCCVDCNEDIIKEWKFDKFKEVLLELKSLGGMYIEFTGGESILNSDLIPMAKLASEENFIFDILTNGTNISFEFAKKIKELYPRIIKIPIYGSKSRIHDDFTNVKGSYKLMMQGIQTLLKVGIKPYLNCGVTNRNINDIENIWEVARKLDLPIRFAYHTTSSLNTNKKNSALIIKDSKRLKELFKNPRYSPIRPEIPQKNKLSSICEAGFNNICFGADGFVFGCDSFREALGNIYNEKLYNLWFNSKFILKWRKLTVNTFSKCERCKIINVCNPCPGDYHLDSGYYNDVDDQTCYFGQLISTIENSERVYNNNETNEFCEKACTRFLPRKNIY